MTSLLEQTLASSNLGQGLMSGLLLPLTFRLCLVRINSGFKNFHDEKLTSADVFNYCLGCVKNVCGKSVVSR